MLGERIRDLRKEKGYSQQQMARKLHITQGAISQWENGTTTPAADQLSALADVFEITVDELLGREEKKPAIADGPGRGIVQKYKQLTPENQARISDLIEVLLSGQE